MSDGTMHPVDVKVLNVTELIAKPRCVARTTFQTYLLDATGAAGDVYVQITDYEPARIRTLIMVIDDPVAISTDKPPTSPGLGAATDAVYGRYLPVSIHEYVLHGPDAFWINTLVGSVTRVTVTREYEK